MNGFIQLPRWIYSHPVMRDPTALQCFLYLLFKARFAPGESFFRKKAISLKFGEAVFSRKELSYRLNIGDQQVRSAIQALERYKLIHTASNRQCSIASIINFGEYQPELCSTNESTNKTTNKTPTKQPTQHTVFSGENSILPQHSNQQNPNEITNKSTNLNKKVNNNINNKIYTRAFEEFWSKYPNRFNRPQTEKNFIKAAKAHGTEAVLRALDNYLAEIKRNGTNKQYIVRSTNFVGQKAYFLGYVDADLPDEGDESSDRTVPSVDETRRMLEKMRLDGDV